MNQADILMATILLVLVIVVVFVAGLGELKTASRLGYFVAGVLIGFIAVRFDKSRP